MRDFPLTYKARETHVTCMMAIIPSLINKTERAYNFHSTVGFLPAVFDFWRIWPAARTVAVFPWLRSCRAATTTAAAAARMGAMCGSPAAAATLCHRVVVLVAVAADEPPNQLTNLQIENCRFSLPMTQAIFQTTSSAMPQQQHQQQQPQQHHRAATTKSAGTLLRNFFIHNIFLLQMIYEGLALWFPSQNACQVVELSVWVLRWRERRMHA